MSGPSSASPAADAVFQFTSDAVILLDASDIVRAANPRVESLFQCPTDGLIGAALERCIPDFKGSAAQSRLAELRGAAVERRVDHFSASRYTWYEIRRIPWKEWTLLFIRDVTDRVRQTRTDAVREGVRQIIMDAPVAISITRGPEHRYELVNAMAQRLIGNRAVEGRTARAAFPEVDRSLFDILDEVYRTGRTITMKDLAVAFDREGNGALTGGTFDVTYQPLREADGQVSGILSVSVETSGPAAAR